MRYASGADGHTKEVDCAYRAGKLRCVFLKGLAASAGAGLPERAA